MLIDRVMSFCDSEYRNAHRNTRCEDCLHTGDCSRNCKDCLEEIHYPSRHPNGKKFYDCPHLINFYVCDYAVSYTHLDVYKRQVILSEQSDLQNTAKNFIRSSPRP